jgi:hypothetical protein
MKVGNWARIKATGKNMYDFVMCLWVEDNYAVTCVIITNVNLSEKILNGKLYTHTLGYTDIHYTPLMVQPLKHSDHDVPGCDTV